MKDISIMEVVDRVVAYALAPLFTSRILFEVPYWCMATSTGFSGFLC